LSKINTEFIEVGKTVQLPPGSRITVRGIDRVAVCLINVDGTYYAFSNICPHKGAPLNEGEVARQYIVCPWHKARFNVKDGTGHWPSPRGIRSYEVKVEGDSILLRKLPNKPWTKP
jgi:nitrite reductase/ring-hydroxylating ferredoxin subunit